MLVFIASFLITFLAAFIQTTNWFFLGIAKPNLILVTLIILATMNQSWLKRAILISVAALILQFAPNLTLPDLLFIGAATLSIALLDFLPWREFINLGLAAILGTIIINLEQFSFLLVYELALNLAFIYLLFLLVKLVYVPKIELQRNKF